MRLHTTVIPTKVGSFQFAQAVSNVAKLYKVLALLIGGMFIILLSLDFSSGTSRNVNLSVSYRSPVSHSCWKQQNHLCRRLPWFGFQL